MTYSLDANICIYFLTGKHSEVRQKLQSIPVEQIRIPAVVEAELLFGSEKSEQRDRNLARVQKFLSAFEIVPFDSHCAEFYARTSADLERRGTPIGPSDLFIAATVMAHSHVLVTNNVKEFRRIPGLQIENWVP